MRGYLHTPDGKRPARMELVMGPRKYSKNNTLISILYKRNFMDKKYFKNLLCYQSIILHGTGCTCARPVPNSKILFEVNRKPDLNPTRNKRKLLTYFNEIIKIKGLKSCFFNIIFYEKKWRDIFTWKYKGFSFGFSWKVSLLENWVHPKPIYVNKNPSWNQLAIIIKIVNLTRTKSAGKLKK